MPPTSDNSAATDSAGKPDQEQQSARALDLTSPRLKLRRKIRHFSDQAAKVSIGIGGISVIVAILLIFLYLFYEVVPLFASAELEQTNEFQLDGATGETLHLAIDEQSEIGMRLNNAGQVSFFNLASGDSVQNLQLPLPAGAAITSFALDSEESGLFALGFSNGRALVARYGYQTSFAPGTNERNIRPIIEYPFGEDLYALFNDSELNSLAIRTAGESLILVGADRQGEVNLIRASRQTNMFTAFALGGEDASFEIDTSTLTQRIGDINQIYVDNDMRWLFLISDSGLVRLLDVQAVFTGSQDPFISEALLAGNNARPTKVAFLLGGISMLVADNRGRISQWFVVRDEGQPSLQLIRTFRPAENAIADITAEQRRKNFVAVDRQGTLAIYNTTARREVFSEQLFQGDVSGIAISPRGDSLIAETSTGNIAVWQVHNEHPEVSWSALWSRVWYEGYSEPEFIWQSTSATNDFEPKYSLVPLSFGTLKAAFYAMLLATPLAICGAIFTGYFMAPAMRRKVKPLIELMEALPTVVLGFLAGLWLAPFVENNLLGIFSILFILPFSILLASFGWSQLPQRFRYIVPEGWEAGLLIPVILLFGYLSFVIATPLESAFFDGDMRYWISSELGISYDQRNALVVGFAMGFAVIPTIFSIAEDAIFTVPRHLTYGSLALGATPWQSLYRVVLPTASPGIFSALMIGMGRAVGETMIVLMATGNTPVMDINIFEGMRTLAANIAVEIPESEVDSTHYRILFLAALVLFLFTFVFNTIAEVVRQRLRTKYSTI